MDSSIRSRVLGVFSVLLISLVMLAWPVHAGVTAWDIYQRPTGDWFSSGDNYDVGWQWAKSVDNILGAGMGLGNGTVYYVDQNVSVEGDGLSWANAKDTINEAITLCSAGDMIRVAAGSTFTMGAAANEVLVSKGVMIVGEGIGSRMPMFDYTGDVSGAFTVAADNVVLRNLRFHANVTDVNEAVLVSAGSTDLMVLGCLFDVEAEGTDEFIECVDSAGGAASDRPIYIGNIFRMGAGACDAGIEFADSDYAIIKHNSFHGDFGTACLNNITTASNHIEVEGNRFFNGTIGGAAGLNGQPVAEFHSGTSGFFVANECFANVATVAAVLVGADMFMSRNYYNEDEGPAADSIVTGAATSVTATADD